MIIKLNRPSVYQCEGLRLIAGENEVSADDAKKFKANKMVKRDFESGVLEEVKTAAKKPAAPKAEEPKAE